VLLSLCQLVGAATVTEAKLKSAFIYNFTKFIEWPAERFSSASAPIVIGLLADEAMQAELTATIANRTVQGRPLLVRAIGSAADMEGCHLLYVGSGKQSNLVKLRKQTPLVAALLIGDERECRDGSGGICFLQQGDRLRFEINTVAVERSQLKISSHLQKLAVAVNAGP
jgi:hypothetical protein